MATLALPPCTYLTAARACIAAYFHANDAASRATWRAASTLLEVGDYDAAHLRALDSLRLSMGDQPSASHITACAL